jgi:hypothetical protein
MLRVFSVRQISSGYTLSQQRLRPRPYRASMRYQDKRDAGFPCWFLWTRLRYGITDHRDQRREKSSDRLGMSVSIESGTRGREPGAIEQRGDETDLDHSPIES